MDDATTGNDGLTMNRLVQCGWCPVILAHDQISWYLHFADDHKNYNGYSVKYIEGTDWDVAELVETGEAR